MGNSNKLKKILIVFTDPHLPYSPTTLNLYDVLSSQYNVSILAFEPDPGYSSQKIVERNVTYINVPVESAGKPLAKRLFGELEKTFNPELVNKKNLLTIKAKKFMEVIKDFNGEIIAVDFFAMWCVQQVNKSAHLLSLEIRDYDIYKNACQAAQIKSVLIQTRERFDFLFPGADLPVFFVQNAPFYLHNDYAVNLRNKHDLIFCGSAMPGFGIFSCIEFIRDYPEYRLTVKGAIPKFVRQVITKSFSSMLESKTLILDDAYLDPVELNSYISRFYAGFVFYDIYRFPEMHSFNYFSAPSGKLFQYYNAGVPVIGNRLSGLNTVEEFASGILIDSLGAKSIANALDQIENEYSKYVTGASTAAEFYDFKKSIRPFVEFIDKD